MICFWDVAPCSLVEADQRPEDGGSTHFCNVGQLQRAYTALHPRQISSPYDLKTLITLQFIIQGRELQVPESTVRKILRKRLQLYPYKYDLTKSSNNLWGPCAISIYIQKKFLLYVSNIMHSFSLLSLKWKVGLWNRHLVCVYVRLSVCTPN
jgi:hypothetical protein